MVQYIKKCKICGKYFLANQKKTEICYEQHYLNCVVCGKPFEISRNRLLEKDHRTTCSKECSNILRQRTNMNTYGGVAPACNSEVQAKMQSTNMNRYGVKHAMQSDAVKARVRSTNNDKYGADYFLSTDEYKQKAKATSLKKYGTAHPMQSEVVKQKTAKTVEEKYGNKNFFKTDRYNACLAEYQKETGYSDPLHTPKANSARIAALSKKYGGVGLGSPQIQDTIKTSCIDRYGVDNPMKNKDIVQTAKDTTLLRYGNSCYLQSDEGRQKTKAALMTKYGATAYAQSREYNLSVMSDPSKIDNLEAFNNAPRKYIKDNFNDSPTLNELAQNIGITAPTISTKIIDNHCEDLISYTYSNMEKDVFNVLKAIDPNLTIVTHDRTIIKTKELDFYLPEYKIGIECNPTSTHNSSINTFGRNNEPPKPSTYHKMKTDACEAAGVFLFHIFGYEWAYKKDIIISMLRNLLGKTENRIYARNCDIRHISNKDHKEFLNDNHRQGSAPASVKLGLYHNNQLVSIMTFGKMRNTIGTDNTDLSKTYELVRFCNKTNTSVVGGASKLFKHFVDTYHPAEIRSFSDRAHTRGNLYVTLGFTELRRSMPNYVWVNMNNERAYSRLNAQKRNIKAFLKDDTLDLSKTEKELMISHGYVQVYDSGTITWVYRSK